MTVASLEGYSSYVREVDGECVFVRVANNLLFSGSRSGEVACWEISSGVEIWRRNFEGPCSDSYCDNEVFFLTESDNIHAIGMHSGEDIWSVRLEGSSDFVRVSNGSVWVTTSVYNFEIQDYSEGAVWQIDFDGVVRNKWETFGRAWSLSDQKGKLVLGLSRPKSGYAIVSDNGVVYPDLEQPQPVTTGNGGGVVPVVLGHSDGSVSEIVDHGVKSVSQVESSVRAIDYFGGWVVGMDSGVVASSEDYGSWSVNLGGIVDVLRFGPSLVAERGVWVPSWRNGESAIFLINLKEGNVELEISHNSRIVSAFSNEDLICFGDDAGCIFVVEGDVVRRRFSRPVEEMAEEDRSSELRRKIRRLRGG
ncbi:MAG: hypothetical protein CMA59_05075 [Euryarchaeota archaeon]|jgi:hypothetical protein|nr:hypothetical protein [Euryarchaeota archaeon]|tara:strand:- start:45 stop:1133 length:1089 start_codon:yes stop_codon:yes gene_type:complete